MKKEKVSKSIWETSTNTRKRYPKVTLYKPHAVLGMTDKKFRMAMIEAYDFTAKAAKKLATQSPKQSTTGDDA